jgi:hypothetical protein
MSMLTFSRVPPETYFVLVSDCHNPQRLLFFKDARLWVQHQVATGNQMKIRYLPVPDEIREELLRKNGQVVLVALPFYKVLVHDTVEHLFHSKSDMARQVRELLDLPVRGVSENPRTML